MSERLNWDINADANNIRGTAIELRSKVAKNIYLPAFSTQAAAKAFLDSPRTTWRLRCLDKAEIFLGKQLSGTVIEIGAGTAWCSAILSKKETVDKVYALDYDPVSVDQLMPAAFSSFGADENKITRVIGSYNKIDLDNASVDYVISIGALHHSENLEETLSESHRILKPGGALIASEPCYVNTMTVTEQRQRENEILSRDKVEKLYGGDTKDVRAIDNSDHFYRLSEYESAANRSGLNCYPYVFDATPHSGGYTKLISRYIRDNFYGDRLFSKRVVYKGFEKKVMYPYFAVNANKKPIYDHLLLLLVKPHG